jgi:hypothetical protein
MMNEAQSPRRWTAPNWHADFGDPKLELEHLKTFALALLALSPNIAVTLETPESGLMDLEIRLADGSVAEVYSIPCVDQPDERRFAMYLAPGTPQEKECYANTIDSAVNCCKDWLNK